MTLQEAAEKLGIKYPTAATWLQKGLVSADGGGQHWRAYEIGPKELRELAVIKHLREAGVSLQAIRTSADTLRAVGANPFSEGEFLAVDHGQEIIRRIDETEAMATVKKGGQMLLLLPDDPTK